MVTDTTEDVDTLFPLPLGTFCSSIWHMGPDLPRLPHAHESGVMLPSKDRGLEWWRTSRGLLCLARFAAEF